MSAVMEEGVLTLGAAEADSPIRADMSAARLVAPLNPGAAQAGSSLAVSRGAP